MNRRWLLALLSIWLFTTTLSAQTKLQWKTMEGIGFTEKYVKDLEETFKFPVFTSYIKSLNGKTVEVEGYLIPFDKSGKEVALSANPYAACFFCGKAGPASIMILKLKIPNTKLKTDMYKTVTGRLKLNFDDPEEFYYILEDAVIID